MLLQSPLTTRNVTLIEGRIRFVSPTHVFVSGLSSKLSGEHSQDRLSNPATLGECGECEVIRNHFSQSCNIMLLVTQYLAIIRGWNRRVFSKLIDIIDWRRALSIYKERKKPHNNSMVKRKRKIKCPLIHSGASMFRATITKCEMCL